MQLKFRQQVLQQHPPGGDKSLFLFSSGGKPHTVDKLASNLKALVCDAFTEAPHAATAGDDDAAVPLLVGKKIIHYQNVGGERTPFQGQVISQVPGFPLWYNVKYDNDEAIYSYTLLDDYSQGDLTICVTP